MEDFSDHIEQRYGQGSLFEHPFGDSVKFDAFMQINGHRPRRSLEWIPDTNGQEVEAFYHFGTERHTLTHINAVWVDVDCRTKGLAVGDAVGAVESLIQSGSLPRQSAEVLSGRGVWYMWYLADIHGTAPRATKEVKEAAEGLNRLLFKALQNIGGDSSAVNLNRWMRIDGSVNTNTPTGERVAFRVTQKAGGPLTYTIDELERLTTTTEFLNIPDQLAAHLRERGLSVSKETEETARPITLVRTTKKETERKARKTEPRPDGQEKDRKKQASGVIGNRKVYQVRRSVIEYKAKAWGGIPVGKRNAVLLHYTKALFHLGYKEPDQLRRAAATLPLQGSESDPFTQSELKGVVKSVRKSAKCKPITYQNLAELLELTDTERIAFYVETGEPFPLPHERMSQAREKVGRLFGQDQRREILKVTLTEFRASGNEWPGHHHFRTHTLNPRLKDAGFPPVSRATYHRDREAIGDVETRDGEPLELL